MSPQLTAWCERPPRSVLYDEATDALMDVASGKQLTPDALDAVEERSEPRMLGVRTHDGRAFALSVDGIAFAPGFLNTGPLEELPAAVCWSDFRAMSDQLKRELYGAAEPSGATVRVLMCCLAIVDGARAVGFDVTAEDRELEWHLKELERRAPK
jgi:hypothetical protein